jgi:hypothetical protein
MRGGGLAVQHEGESRCGVPPSPSPRLSPDGAEGEQLGVSLEVDARRYFASALARPLRLAFPGALYHVTSRGNARLAVYHDAKDRHLFLKTLQDVARVIIGFAMRTA